MAMKRLNNRNVFPTDEVLQNALGRRYTAYQVLISSLTSPEYGLTAEWRYYIDGKWLCKVCHKKKTIFWLSIWDKFIQITFYLMERHRDGISELAIDETLKSEFYQSEPVGTHLPLVIRVTKKKQIQDVLAITRYKKSLK